MAVLMRERTTVPEAHESSEQRQQSGFSEEYGSYDQFARAESFHQANFGAVLEDRGRHGGGYCQRGGKESRQRDQENQAFDARQHRALIPLDLTDLRRLGMWVGLR